MNTHPLLTQTKVLIVEDNDCCRIGLERLVRTAGHEVMSASCVREALEMLDGHTHVLLDLHLPDGLGVEVLRVVRASGSQARVALTTAAMPDSEAMLLAMELRPDAVFGKPFNLDHLMHWLAA